MTQFTYLGSILSSNCDLSGEIQHRLKQASSSFGRLMQRVFLNRNLTITTKVAVYKAICISTLLYGCESWTPCRRHIKLLEAFHTQCLRTMFNIHWWHHVTNVDCKTTTKSCHLLIGIHTLPEATPLGWSRCEDAHQPPATTAAVWRTQRRSAHRGSSQEAVRGSP